MSVRELFQASVDAKDKAGADAAQVEADRAKLAADQQQAIVSAEASVVADKALADGTPEGKVFVIDTTAVLKLHGTLEILPTGDPDSE